MSVVVGKVGIKPESFSMSFIKYIGCIIFESIAAEFENHVGF